MRARIEVLLPSRRQIMLDGLGVARNLDSIRTHVILSVENAALRDKSYLLIKVLIAHSFVTLQAASRQHSGAI